VEWGASVAHHFRVGAVDDPFVIGSRLYSRRTDENSAQRVWFECTPHPYGDRALGGTGAGPMSALSRVRPDEFTIAMVATVTLGFLPPCRGTSAEIFAGLAAAAIGLLFFLQGARLSRAAIIAGALHWRLHLVIFAATFVLFPVVGLCLRPLSGTLLTPPLYLGLLFLCTLPSTVQDSVAFTSIAGGNVAAALCSASA
jgi:sodium/bile acid cotransporter family protein DUF4137